MGGGYLQPRVLLDLFPCFGLDSTLESEKKLTFHFPDSRCLRRFAASPLKKKNYQHDTPLHNSVDDNLVGGFNPFEKNYWNHQPVYNYWIMVFSVPCSLLHISNPWNLTFASKGQLPRYWICLQPGLINGSARLKLDQRRIEGILNGDRKPM